jgi:hypothetical protein
MNDFKYQADAVVKSVDRILSLLDNDRLSPTFGCCDLAYWRDKTVDVADMRRQEVAFPLALLYTHEIADSPWKGNARLLEAISALLSFWCRNRHRDGALDEWYKGERGFAVAAFSTHAVAQTLLTIGDALQKDFVAQSKACLAQTAEHLMDRDDLFKTNHQAVAVAALAYAGKILEDRRLTENARTKLEGIIAAQTPEGWFPELGHMDVGYTFLTVEYVAMAMELWNDWSRVVPFQRAFDFACEWVHPDLTLGDEYGVCQNPYISRIAVLLMSKFSSRAAGLCQRFETQTAGPQGLKSTLADDLRLCRWAFQPLLAYRLLHTGIATAKPPEPLPLLNPSTSEGRFPLAGLARFSRPSYRAVVAPAAGGLVRIFADGINSPISDYGYVLKNQGGYATNTTYNRTISCEFTQGTVTLSATISPVRKFMPPWWTRVALRLACSTAIGSKLARTVIDIYRKRLGTALNQSSANLPGRSSPWRLERNIKFNADEVTIVDRLTFDQPVETTHVFMRLSEDATRPAELRPLPLAADTNGSKTARELQVRKVITVATGDISIVIGPDGG